MVWLPHGRVALWVEPPLCACRGLLCACCGRSPNCLKSGTDADLQQTVGTDFEPYIMWALGPRWSGQGADFVDPFSEEYDGACTFLSPVCLGSPAGAPAE